MCIIAQESSRDDHYDRPLSKLERIHPFEQEGYEAKSRLQTLNPFLLAPSIRELYCVSTVAVNDGYTGYPFDWQYPSLDSNLEKVEFSHSCVMGSVLAKFLAHTPRLRFFKLSHEVKWHGCGHDWDANAIFTALAHHCGNTLEELSVTIVEDFGGEIKAGVQSLRQFTKLEHLEIDIRFFFGPPVTDELREMWPDDYRAHAHSIGWNEATVPSLVDILPLSIKTLRLVVASSPDDYAVFGNLFKDFGLRKRDALPLLESVIIV